MEVFRFEVPFYLLASVSRPRILLSRLRLARDFILTTKFSGFFQERIRKGHLQRPCENEDVSGISCLISKFVDWSSGAYTNNSLDRGSDVITAVDPFGEMVLYETLARLRVALPWLRLCHSRWGYGGSIRLPELQDRYCVLSCGDCQVEMRGRRNGNAR